MRNVPLLLVTLLTHAVSALAAPPTLVVLQDAPGTDDAAREVLSRTAREEVERSAGYTWQTPPPITVDELVLAAGCSSPDQVCMGRIGDLVKADAVLLVQVEGGKTVRALLVQSRPQKRVVRGAAAATTPAEFGRAAAEALRSVLGPLNGGVLDIATSPPGATVLLDGKPVGNTPLVVDGVRTGKHVLAFSLAGHVPGELTIQVAQGTTSRVSRTMVPSSGAPVAAAPAPVAPAPAQAAPATTPPPAPTVREVSAQPDPSAQKPAAAPAAAKATSSSSSGGLVPLPVRLGLMAAGGVGAVFGVLGVVLGGMAAAYAASLYVALASRTFQRAADLGVTYYPAYIVGFALAASGILVALVAGGLLVAGIVLGVVG